MKKLLCIIIALTLCAGMCGCSYETVKKYVPPGLARELKLYNFFEVANGESIGTMDGETLVKGETESTDERLEDLFYYNLLDDETRYIYRVFLWTAESFTENWVKVNNVKNLRYKLFIAYRAVINDFPEYFWIPSAYSISTDSNNTAISFYKTGECKVNAETATEMLNSFNDIAATIIETANKKEDIFEKELFLHDTVCKLCTYSSESEYPYSAYGALVEGEAVCEGYARAFYYLCKKAGINNMLINGNSRNEGHIWNAVELDGDWYHVDTTWDDMEYEPAHGYFNLTEEEICKDHYIKPIYTDMDVDIVKYGETFNFIIPEATATKYNYFAYKNINITSYEIKRTAAEIIKRYKEGHNTAQISFITEDEMERYERIYEQYVVDVQKEINNSLGKGVIKLKSVAVQLNTVILHWENQ